MSGDPVPGEALVSGHDRAGMFGVEGSGDTSGFGGLRVPAYLPPPARRPYGSWCADSEPTAGVDPLFQPVQPRTEPALSVFRRRKEEPGAE